MDAGIGSCHIPRSGHFPGIPWHILKQAFKIE